MINILGMLPQLMQLIVGVEQLIPQPGNGPQKLEAVKTIVAGTLPPQQQPQVMAQLEQWISLIVMFMNLIGTFRTAAQPAQPVQPNQTFDISAPNFGQGMPMNSATAQQVMDAARLRAAEPAKPFTEA